MNPIVRGSWDGSGVEPDIQIADAKILLTAHRLAVTSLIAAEPDAARPKSLLDRLTL